jgi:prepilin-type N-terminal cleavage/methylation domain-containing protein
MTKIIRIIQGRRGFALLETMCAIAIFGIVLAGILDLCVSSMATGKRAEYAYTAYNLAKNRLETLRSMPYSTLASAAETDLLLDANGVADIDGDFIRSTSVTSSYGGDANLTQVTVSINYIYRGTQTTTPTQLSTIIYQYG